MSGDEYFAGLPEDQQPSNLPARAVMTPHKCPVCEGRGTVSQHFYSGYYNPTSGTSSLMPPRESCRACGGVGVLWR